MASSEDILKVRYELADTSELPVMSDAEISYYIDKHSGSIRRASLDTARAALFKMSMQGDSSVDIFSLRSSSSAKAYMEALKMYIQNPDLNNMYAQIAVYAGGISKSDMLANDSDLDNNTVVKPTEDRVQQDPSNPFGFIEVINE